MQRARLRWSALTLLAAAAAAMLPACSSGQAGSIPIAATPNVSASSTLQFAVGTATIGTAGGGSSVGLNVVATFRQPNGTNATNVNTPTLTAPKGVNFGPLLGNSNVISGVNPAQLAALSAQSKVLAKGTFLTIPPSFGDGFGPLVGVFGYGLAADNLISNTDYTNVLNGSGISSTQFCAGIGTNYFDAGTTVPEGFTSGGFGAYYGLPPALGTGVTTSNNVRSAELALPVPSGTSGGNCTCPSTCAPNNSNFVDGAFPLQYFGGPPAWPSPQGYGNYSYFVGYPMGFTTFTAAPAAGNYSLAVAYPTGPTYAAFGTISAAATLKSVAPLPVFPQPALTINPDGSGVVTVDVPAGLKEAVITIVTNDCDLVGRDLTSIGIYANHFALETQQAGPQTLFLSSALGPPSTVTGLPTHTFCTVSDVQAQNAAVNGSLSSYVLHTAVAAVGFDYGAVEASYPFSSSVAPPIVGTKGQADVTTSYPTFITTTLTLPTGS
jgi:hypothetical protein